MSNTEPETPVPASLLVRLAAIFYDAILLIALWFVASVPVTLLHGGAMHGEWWYRAYLLLVGFAFLGWFWTHGGSTLGMQAWRLRIEREDGQTLTWRDALVRYLMSVVSWSLFGLGFLWSLWDAQRRTWHDRLSKTRLVRLPKRR